MTSHPDLLRTLARLLPLSIERLHSIIKTEQFQYFERYHRELQKWNKTIKLTGIQTFQEFVDRHLIDSLIAIPSALSLSGGESIVDIGSGAGFPGLPLAILFPDQRWILVESRQRRAAFLHHLQRTFALSNVQVLTSRIAGKPDREGITERSQMILFRAVNPREILPLAPRYLKEGGECLYWASENSDLPLPPGLQEVEGQSYTLPSGESFLLRRFSLQKITTDAPAEPLS